MSVHIAAMKFEPLTLRIYA